MFKLNLLVLVGILSFCTASLMADGSFAIQEASQENKHLFIFFYKDQNEKTANLQKIFDQTMQQMGSQVKSIKIKANDPAEKSLAERFSLKRSPMPFVVVLAPNGAITGGFFTFNQDQLKNALSSAGTASILKALQDRKLVLISLQNSQTTQNEAALKGVRDFKADPRFSNATELVTIDPADPKEQKFLQQLGVKASSNQAVTLLVSPPADVVGTYRGATTKEQFVTDLQSATAGCCPGGCCPGGCCPGGKCCPR